MQEDPIDHFHRYWRFVISWKWTQVPSPQPHICPYYHTNHLIGHSSDISHLTGLFHIIITSQAVLLVVATVALAAPASPTGAHAAWPLPYAG